MERLGHADLAVGELTADAIGLRIERTDDLARHLARFGQDQFDILARKLVEGGQLEEPVDAELIEQDEADVPVVVAELRIGHQRRSRNCAVGPTGDSGGSV